MYFNWLIYDLKGALWGMPFLLLALEILLALKVGVGGGDGGGVDG